MDFSKTDKTDTVAVQIALRGINQDRSIKTMPSHVVDVLFNGEKIDTLQWDGKVQYQSSFLAIPRSLIKESNQLTLLVPKRKEGKKKILDVVMLDYINFKFVIDATKISDSYDLYSENNCRVKLAKDEFSFSKKAKKYSFKNAVLSPNEAVHIGKVSALKDVLLKELEPFDFDVSTLDYVMISHPLFVDSLKPLAEFYQNKGQNVAIVDVNTVYQHYSHGVRELAAIKEFIKTTFHAGKSRLKHVLLVGDSSWDWRSKEKYLDKYASWANRRQPLHQNFIGQMQYTYEEDIANRDFMPTGQFHSFQGHSASDNWFASIVAEKNRKGEDYLPDVAIGRFTCATVEEAKAMVEKSINYQANAKVGPWKSRVLWITNSDKRYQNYSKTLGKVIGDLGAVAETVFPKEMDGDNFKVQETLKKEISDGDLIVHFVGHGGNSIWRIGPPDLKNNRDLFTIKQVDELSNKNKLPFVMSMSCYSAPYDHPLADSIGEKFFRAKDKGAIAVLAASWRNSPNQNFSKAVLENIYKTPRQSLGLAIMNAKREYRGRVAVEMYNLLGDPALHLALPALTISSQVDLQKSKAQLSIDAESFNGKVNLEFIDHSNQVIKKQQISTAKPEFGISFETIKEQCKQVRVYAWDTAQNTDAMTSFSCSIVDG